MTPKEELRLEDRVITQILDFLDPVSSSASSERLVKSTSAALDTDVPEYMVNRAVWSLIADGKAELTRNYEVRLIPHP